MVEGSEYPVELKFREHDRWYGNAKAYEWDNLYKGLELKMSIEHGGFAQFVDEIQRARNVRLIYGSELVAIVSLSGSFVAMEETLNCQSTTSDLFNEVSKEQPNGLFA